MVPTTSQDEILLACAEQRTLRRIQTRLQDSDNPQLRAAAELIDEASLYLSLAIAGN